LIRSSAVWVSDTEPKANEEVLKKASPEACFNKVSRSKSGLFWCSSAAASTASFVGASTHSKRRSRVKGKIMRPYWLCLKLPRSKSATDQIKLAIWEWLVV